MKRPRPPAIRPALAVLLLLAYLGGLAGTAAAQGFGGEAFGGFSASSDDPILVEADRLEVRDEEKIAIYSGNVKVRQAETVLETTELIVYYSGNQTEAQEGAGDAEAEDGTASALGGGPGASITRIEAEGGVIVTTEDKTATGEQAVFDMETEVVTLLGNVILTQGDNVVRGEKLVVDLTTKQAEMMGGRVQTIIAPGSANQPGQ
ncbi:LptA/OstA family protein [Afifella pfennigii]|uniref:LptA/OstA family protein n=1 Tax=Afifella pfennigii TaxID=209897 RepID=UPI000689F375|nr:LptA/OstA family protein [Afifella pfennigii]